MAGCQQEKKSEAYLNVNAKEEVWENAAVGELRDIEVVSVKSERS